MITRLKELESENARLKKMYADVQLQNDVELAPILKGQIGVDVCAR